MASRLLLIMALMLGIPAGLTAQTATPVNFGTPASLQRLAPTPARPIAPVHSGLALAAAGRTSHHGKKEAVALMIVGGAGLVTGLIVDESVITIAGAGVAGFGLYLYLR